MKALLLMYIAVALSGCSGHIPNRISPDEYALYSEYMRANPAANGSLYVGTRTFSFDPLERFGCGKTMHDKARVPWSLMKQLHAIGTAQYPLDIYGQQQHLRVSQRFQAVEDARSIADRVGTYHLVSFSRAAFNGTGKDALFAVSVMCGVQCGGGGAVYAHRSNGRWVFENGGCNWVY